MDWGLRFPWKLVPKNLLKLTFFVQTYRKSSQVKKKLAMKFEPAQIIRKSTQANASHRKSSQVSGQTRHKSTQVKTCDDLRSRLIRPLEKVM